MSESEEKGERTKEESANKETEMITEWHFSYSKYEYPTHNDMQDCLQPHLENKENDSHNTCPSILKHDTAFATNTQQQTDVLSTAFAKEPLHVPLPRPRGKVHGSQQHHNDSQHRDADHKRPIHMPP